MQDIKILTSYNVNLTNFVDLLSQWDYFVTDTVFNYFEVRYRLTDEDKKHLKAYAELRKILGWSEEINLFNWAHANFPQDTKFTPLLEHIRYFESRISTHQTTLQVELSTATENIQQSISKLTKVFKSLDLENLITRFSKVFASDNKKGTLPTYITYSPVTTTQGGANGQGIYTQMIINGKITDGILFSTAAVIAHEYLHKELTPGNYFAKNYGKESLYNQIFEAIYPDVYSNFVEEVIIYAIADVIIEKQDPLVVLQRYKTEDKDLQTIYLWETVVKVTPILIDYLEEKLSVEEARKKLDIVFHNTISSLT